MLILAQVRCTHSATPSVVDVGRRGGVLCAHVMRKQGYILIRRFAALDNNRFTL
jgi:hypothetical protein